MLIQYGTCHSCATLHCRRARHAVWIKRVDIPAGREHARAVAQQVPSRGWQDILPVHRPDNTVQLLARAFEQVTNLDSFREDVAGALIGRRWEQVLHACSHLLRGVATASDGSCQVGWDVVSEICLEILRQLRLGRLLAKGVQSFREQAVLDHAKVLIHSACIRFEVFRRDRAHVLCCELLHIAGRVVDVRAVLLEASDHERVSDRLAQLVVREGITAIVLQQLTELGHLLVETRAAVWWHVVRDHRPVATALRDDGL
mmetsp:Transcript_1572/g.5387  ORF Transcript_1572/g.5387 Transcript_1572/m.5387 type:complete len:258 (+) Transcript_1572:2708-3481(+)